MKNKSPKKEEDWKKHEEIAKKIMEANDNMKERDAIHPTPYYKELAKIHVSTGKKYMDLFRTIIQNFEDNKIGFVENADEELVMITKGKSQSKENIGELKVNE